MKTRNNNIDDRVDRVFNNVFKICSETGPYREKRIQTKKYLWHVSSPLYRYSINEMGIITNDSWTYLPAVFANNMLYPDFGIFMRFWDDYTFDIFDNPSFEDVAIYFGLDFWQIDTDLYKGHWFLDHVYELDYCGRQGMDYYVYTYNNIPRNAIKLFRYRKPKHYFYEGSVEGVAHSCFTSTFYEFKFPNVKARLSKIAG